MSFKVLLENLVNAVPGATGAILADWEGESVDYYSLLDDFELKILAAHKGIILNQIREAQSRIAAGTIQETVITTENQHVIVGAIGDDYSLVMTLDRGSVVGRALYHFRQSVQLLDKEIN